MQAALRTGRNALPAADAFRGTGDFLHGKRHGTGIFTGLAGNAFFLFPVDLHQTEPLEPAVDRPQRAQVLAEGAVHLYGQDQKEQQYSQLPEKQTAWSRRALFVPSRGRAPKNVPEGHGNLQNAGILA